MKLPRIALTLSVAIGLIAPSLAMPSQQVQAIVNLGYANGIFYLNDAGSQSTIRRIGNQDSLIVDFSGVIPEPAISPDNKRIAYVSGVINDFRIYAVNVDGTNKVQLTSQAQSNSAQPTWSPDGTKIAFSTSRNSTANEIYVMNADGSGQINLTNHAGYDMYPAWSPDGSKIAFASNRFDHLNYDLYVMNADGSNLTRIADSPGYDMSPQWSPDGSKILFLSDRDGGVDDVFIMDANGGNQINISNSANLYEEDPAWSPDGKYISYIQYSEDWTASLLIVVDIINNERTVIDLGSEGIDIIDNPKWSPDGKGFVFTGADSDWSAYNLYSIQPDKSNLEQLTFDGASYAGQWITASNISPVVAPDSLTTHYGVPGLVDVLVNDKDEEILDSKYLTIKTQPLNGSASIESGKVKYTPNAGFHGSDQLTYQICDVFLLDQKCATGVLSITVQAPGAPVLTVAKVDGTTFESSTSRYTTSTRRPTFSGTASPNATIKVEIHSDPIVLTTTANADGNWSVTPTQDLPAGEHTVYITATLNGVTTELDSFVLSITADQTIPNTGATTWPLRVGGLGLLLAGAGLTYLQRRWIGAQLSTLPRLY